MRIELRAQRAQFRVARHDFELQLPPLGLPGEFEREQQVMHRQRQQKQQHARGEQQRLVARVLLGSGSDGGDGAEQGQPGARQPIHETAGDHRRHRGGRKHTRRAARRQRRGMADVPRGETHERVDKADRQEQHQRGQPRHVLSRQDRGEQHRHDDPGGEIRRQPFHARENRVHAIRRQFLISDAAHHHEAAHAQPRRRRIGGMPGLVLVSSHRMESARRRRSTTPGCGSRSRPSSRITSTTASLPDGVDGFPEVEFAAAHEAP